MSTTPEGVFAHGSSCGELWCEYVGGCSSSMHGDGRGGEQAGNPPRATRKDRRRVLE